MASSGLDFAIRRARLAAPQGQQAQHEQSKRGGLRNREDINFPNQRGGIWSSEAVIEASEGIDAVKWIPHLTERIVHAIKLEDKVGHAGLEQRAAIVIEPAALLSVPDGSDWK